MAKAPKVKPLMAERASQDERLNALLELLAERGRLSVQEAMDELDVSSATIRRDLDHLRDQQLIRRTRGGAVATSGYDLPLKYKPSGEDDPLPRIAQAMADLIGPGETVGITAGPVALQVARALGARTEQAERVDPTLTVVTNAINVAYELAIRPGVDTLVVGGRLRSRSYSLVGEQTRDAVSRLRLDTVIVDAGGIDTETGLSCASDSEAEVARAMLARAGRLLVVAEGRAVGRPTLAQICPAAQVTHVITDAQADPASLAELREVGPQVTVV